MKLRNNYLVMTLLGCLITGTAMAEAQHFELPAQSLASSLKQLAGQAKIQIFFESEQLQGVQAPQLKGEYEITAALKKLLDGSGLEWVATADAFVVRRSPTDSSTIALDSLSILGDGVKVDAASVGRSTLTSREIERQQADNIPSLLQTLPGVTMGGSAKPGGQTMNIWGLGDAEDVPFTLDGASKSGFERYQQGTVFIEPELIRRIEVEKGPYSVFTGNGGFGGTVHMETKNATDLLEQGRNLGGMLKYGYHSNDQQKIYTGALYGRTEDGRGDALAYLTTRDGRDMKLAGNIEVDNYQYPQRYPYTDQKLDGILLKGNFRPTTEHEINLSYSRTHSETFTPFSAVSYVLPGVYSINQRGSLDAALRRLMADREVTDSTWAATYRYQPLENPWIDLELKGSWSKTEQLDERREGASYSLATGGKRIDTEYQDKVAELRNTSRFSTATLDHEVTTGVSWHHHKREVLMYMPGSTYETERYNYGWFQPYFMPHGSQTSRGAYLQDAISLGSVTITPSLRFDSVINDGKPNLASIYNNPERGHDYSSKSYSGWSPRLSLFWQIDKRFGLFADYVRTWRAPVIDEQYEVQNSTTIGGSSRSLDAEQLEGVRGGATMALTDLLSNDDSLQVRTTLFRHRIEDEIFKLRSVACENQAVSGGSISARCAGDLPLPNYRNLPGLTIKGFEVEAYYDSRRLFGSLSYTWLSGRHEGAYSNPWGPDVWARDISPPKWVASLGVKIPELDSRIGWQGEFVRKTDRLPSDRYYETGEIVWDHYANNSYDTHRLFAEWTPKAKGLKGTKVNLTVDNIFNRFYRSALSGDSAYSQGRNAKVSVTRFF